MTGPGLEHSAALIRLFDLLASGRPADARAVAAALPEEDLAAVVDAAGDRVSLPVRGHILSEGTSRTLIALARYAVSGVEGGASTMDRVLLRFDPEADAAVFFDLDTSLLGVRRARRLILRDRQGPDGHAVIPPRVKQALLDAVADTEPDPHLRNELALADDPDLVMALVPYADRLSCQEAANVIGTLVAYGRRQDAKRHRALWPTTRREFYILGFRRYRSLPGPYTPFLQSIARVDPRVDGMDAEAYVDYYWRQRAVGYLAIREGARVALLAGTMVAAEVLEHTRPARVAVTLAVCKESSESQPGERRAADDVRVLLDRYTADRLADDPDRWARVIAGVNTFPGTVPDLLAEAEAGVEADAEPDPESSPNHRSSSLADVNAANILLALAPRAVAEQVVAAKSMERTIAAVAGEAPLCRALVEHVLTRGTFEQRLRLAANNVTPDAVLLRLLEQSRDDTILHAILERDFVAREVLRRVYVVVPRDDWLRRWILQRAQDDPATALDALRHTTDDMAWMLETRRSAFRYLYRRDRILADAMLAEAAGVEAVWAMELDRAGTLESMAPHVRASMGTGDAEPLIQAARAAAAEQAEELEDDDLDDDDPLLNPPRTLAGLDDPFSRPLEALIRSRLDGRLDRWLHLAELLRARPNATDEELISEFDPL